MTLVPLPRQMNDDIKQYVLEKAFTSTENRGYSSGDGGSGMLYIRRASRKSGSRHKLNIRNSKGAYVIDRPMADHMKEHAISSIRSRVRER